MYLLQKREENAISLGIPVPNAKVIDKAKSSKKPVSPNIVIVYTLALILGFLVPIIVISLILLFDTKIHTRDDIEFEIGAPVIGEIPHSKSKNKIVLNINNNDNVSEAFRLLRTNLIFMLNGKGDEKLIFVTSSIGSEGKTFVSLNLATSLVLLNKKVLLVEADVRKPKLASYLGIARNVGLTDYIINSDITVRDIIVSDSQTGMDVVLSGTVPPNPSEILTNSRFEDVLEYGKKNYDFVLVDTAPVNMVTDTLIIGHQADLFIYVVRANYLDKRMLKIPKSMYANKRLPNMTLIVNDVDYKKSGYGYGYGYDDDKNKPWYKRVFQ